jgi:hypothetical protein
MMSVRVQPSPEPAVHVFSAAKAQEQGGRGGGPQGRFGPQYGGLGGGGRSGSAYWGGRNITPEPPTLEDETLPQGVTTSPEGKAAKDGKTADQVWCTGYAEGMTSDERFSGDNLRRLEALEAVLAPNFDHRNAKEPILILAGYQEELEKAEPDTAVAGVYLGLVSTVPITPRLVELSNRYLCVARPESGEENAAIALVAEAQRGAARGKGASAE